MEDDFSAELERLRTRREAAENAMRVAFQRSPAVLETEGSLRELWILSPETTPKEGALRITFLAEDGPRGHRSGDDLEDLVGELASTHANYRPVDEPFVVEWTSTPRYEEGVLRVAYVQAFNQLQSIAGRRGAGDWAWKRILESRAKPDVEEATRMLERAARELEKGRALNVRALRTRLLT